MPPGPSIPETVAPAGTRPTTRRRRRSTPRCSPPRRTPWSRRYGDHQEDRLRSFEIRVVGDRNVSVAVVWPSAKLTVYGPPAKSVSRGRGPAGRPSTVAVDRAGGAAGPRELDRRVVPGLRDRVRRAARTRPHPPGGFGGGGDREGEPANVGGAVADRARRERPSRSSGRSGTGRSRRRRSEPRTRCRPRRRPCPRPSKCRTRRRPRRRGPAPCRRASSCRWPRLACTSASVVASIP